MSLDISCSPERSGRGLFEDSSSDLLDSGKVTFEERKGNPDYIPHGISDSLVGVIHLTYLDVYVDKKPLDEVVCIPRDITSELALSIINEFGPKFAEQVIKHDSNKCLWFNILYHFRSFDSIQSATSVTSRLREG